MRALDALLRAPIDEAKVASHEAWWARHRAIAAGASSTMEAALLGGLAADRLGYAFASGYQAALRALVPDLPGDRLASLCVTERGGGHPRAIEARLAARGGGVYQLDGHKRWATLAEAGGVLLVVASTGHDAAGKNALRVARVDSMQAGVIVRAMPEPPFTPEIVHAEIDLEGVSVREESLLPGDGFDGYVRPFRTVEDLHVQAAALAYAVREIRANGLPRSLAERCLALSASLVALAEGDVRAPATHVALAGALALAAPLLDEIDRAWAGTGSAAHARWTRDRPLLAVAGKVREQRLSKAWEALSR